MFWARPEERRLSDADLYALGGWRAIQRRQNYDLWSFLFTTLFILAAVRAAVLAIPYIALAGAVTLGAYYCLKGVYHLGRYLWNRYQESQVEPNAFSISNLFSNQNNLVPEVAAVLQPNVAPILNLQQLMTDNLEQQISILPDNPANSLRPTL